MKSALTSCLKIKKSNRENIIPLLCSYPWYNQNHETFLAPCVLKIIFKLECRNCRRFPYFLKLHKVELDEDDDRRPSLWFPSEAFWLSYHRVSSYQSLLRRLFLQKINHFQAGKAQLKSDLKRSCPVTQQQWFSQQWKLFTTPC